MFKNVVGSLRKNWLVILSGLVVGYFLYSTYTNFTNPPELKEFKGSIQNHLVWSNKGECFFVRPYNGTTMYLIRVEDCDKK